MVLNYIGSSLTIRNIEQTYYQLLNGTIDPKLNEMPYMKFIQMQENWDRVTCLSMSKDKQFLAVGGKLREDNSAYIFIYKYINGLFKHERKVIQCGEPTSGTPKEFTTINFSSDTKFVCGFTLPDGQANIWEWNDKIKVISSCMLDSNITRISMSPKDKHIVCTSGMQHFRLWTIQDNTFKGYQITGLNETFNFRDHAWLEDDNIAIIDDKGYIYIIDKASSQVIQQSNAFNMGEQDHYTPSYLLSYSKGFLVGSDQGVMSLWVRSAENSYSTGKQPYDFIRKWSVDKAKSKIVGMAINSAEDMLSIAYAGNEIGLCLIQSLGLNQEYRSTKDIVDREIKGEIICNGFHTKSICAMDIAIQRPLIVTVSKDDCTIRVWNYVNMKCELARKLFAREEGKEEDAKPISCVAFHPSGYYIGCGFVDRVRFFHILYNTLRLFREINIKNANHIRFSHGGNVVLITTEQKGIYLYNSYSLIQLIGIKGPNMPILDISFSSNDMYFCVSSSDGIVAIYNTTTFEKDISEELDHKPGSQYTGTLMDDYVDHVKKSINQEAITQKRNIMLTVGTQGTNNGVVRCFVKGKLEVDFNFSEHNFTKVEKLESLSINPKVFNYVVGTEKGDIITFSYPITPQSPNKGIVDIIHAHRGPVTSIRTSSDGRYIFTSGEDGAVLIYSVMTLNEHGHCIADLVATQPEKEKDKYFDQRALIIDEQLADVLMVEKKDLDEFRIKQNSLISQIDTIEAELVQNKQQQQSFLEEQIIKAEKKREEELKSAEMRIKQLQEHQQRLTQDQSQRLKDMETAHQATMDELQQLYEKKLVIESKKYEDLESINIEVANKFQAQINDLKGKYEKVVEALMSEFKKDFHQIHELNNNEKNISVELERKYEEKLNQLEDEHESEVKELVKKHEIEKHKQFDIKEMLERKKKLVYDDETKLNDQIATKGIEMNSLTNSNKSLMSELEIKRQEILKYKEERDRFKEELDTKKNKLFEYKQKIKELQKYQNVLMRSLKKMKKRSNQRRNRSLL